MKAILALSANLLACLLTFNSIALGSIAQIPISADTFISQDSPNTNYGSMNGYPGLPVSGYDVPPEEEHLRNVLILTDISSLAAPTGYKIAVNSASLNLYQRDSWIMTASMGLYTITSSWNEMTVTWNTSPSTAGSPSTTVTTITGWMQFDISSALVQSWIDGNQQNYGFMIRAMNPTIEGSDHFNSREMIGSWQTDPNYLAIDYTLVPLNPVPIPAAVWLLGSGLIGLLAIRKKLKL